MSQREPFCNHPVAARRVLSPFAGLRRVGPACCTPPKSGGFAVAAPSCGRFVAVVCVGATLACLSLSLVPVVVSADREVMVDE